MNPFLRDQFPILEKLTYLSSHSLGAVPSSTENVLRRYYREWAELGIKAWDGPWWQAVLDFNRQMEQILQAAPGTVVPMQNVTRAMAAVASCFDYRAGRNKIVTTSLEFTTSYPFWRGQEKYGAELLVVESEDGVTLPYQKVVEALDEQTLMVLTSHAFFRSGALMDIESLAHETKKRGVLLMVDGYQTVGSVPVHLNTTPIDFYVGGSHKWLCGGPGAGYLYVAPPTLETLRPTLTGWFGLENPFGYEGGTGPGRLHRGIFKFLAGTPNVAGLYAAKEGLDAILEVGVKQIRAYSQEMTSWLFEQLKKGGYQLKSPTEAGQRNGMICVDFPGAEQACRWLEERDVVVDFRPDCGIRVSPHFYNSRGDLERFLVLLKEARLQPELVG